MQRGLFRNSSDGRAGRVLSCRVTRPICNEFEARCFTETMLKQFVLMGREESIDFRSFQRSAVLKPELALERNMKLLI